MDRNTLIGFILIGIILLLYPSYRNIVSPEQKPKKEQNIVSPEQEPKKEQGVFEEKGSSRARSESASSSFSSSVPSSLPAYEEKEELFYIETSLFSAVVSNKNGGSFSSFKIKKHRKEGEEALELIDSKNQENLLVSFDGVSGPFLLDGFWRTSPSSPSRIFLNTEDKSSYTLSFYREVGSGSAKKSLTFKDGSYTIDIDVDVESLGVPGGEFELLWPGGIKLTEDSKQESLFLEGLTSQAGKIQSYRVGSSSFFGGGGEIIEPETKNYSGEADFVGYRTKYFGVFLVTNKAGDTKFDGVKITKRGGSFRPEVGLSAKQKMSENRLRLFFGPLDYEKVSSLGVGLEKKILGWQWLSSISWLVYKTMVFLYSVVPNYGVVVVLFAIIIKLVTYPLMAKQLRSTKKMQKIQPEINKIKAKYKNDPKMQQQKMASLFQESGVNPLAGCLPMLIQFPVLIAVFMVFRNTIEFRGEPFFLWISDLASPDTLFTLGSLPINVLPFLMSISMYYTMKGASTGQVSADPAQEATQKMMKYMFPGMMFFLFYGFPSGLNLYYFCFNIIQLLQQKIINNEK